MDRRLALQSIVGLPLTALALAGWFALRGPRRRALARGAGADHRRARAARRPRRRRLLRHAELPAGRRHGEGALPAPRGPVLGRSRSASPSTSSWSAAAASASPSSPCSRSASLSPSPTPRSPSSRERVALPPRWASSAVGLLVVAALVGWAVETARYEDRGFQELTRCLVEEKGAPVEATRGPDRPQRRARRARHGDRDEPRHGRGRRLTRSRPSGSPSNYRSVADDLGERLEVRGRTVYLWERPPSPTQRQALVQLHVLSA